MDMLNQHNSSKTSFINLIGQLTYNLFRGYPSQHLQGVYVLGVYPPQETLLVEETEELVCRCWGESFRKYFPARRERVTEPCGEFKKLPDKPIEGSWVLGEET